MKKLLVIAIGVFTAGAVHAQDVSFGIKGGGNMSNIIKTNDDSYESEFKPGFHAGVTMEIGLGNVFSFAPELMFSQKGYKTDNFTGGTYTQTTNWIDIPILAKIEAAPQFNIFLGPQVSFLTQTKNKFEGNLGTFENEIEEDSDTFKKSIAGGVIGAGFDITPKVGISARYAIDFQKTDEEGNTSTPAFKNQVIQAGLGFKF